MKRNRRNYYRVLQVQPDARSEVIKASYRTLMQKLKYHPDLGGDEWNASLINEAYAVLSDPARRAAYDQNVTIAKAGAGVPGRPGPSSMIVTASMSMNDGGGSSCPFCATRNTAGVYQNPSICRGCGGPLTLVGFDPSGRGERRTRRLDHRDEVRFITEWPPTTLYRGNALDLSPTGLRLVSPKYLPVETIIRLETGSLLSIARVTHSRRHVTSRQFAAGVHFLTLSSSRAQGVFVSESA